MSIQHQFPVTDGQPREVAGTSKTQRMSWSSNETNVLVKSWKENHNMLESAKVSEGWRNIAQNVSEVGQGKSVKQCKTKINNLKMKYKESKLALKKTGSSPDLPPFFEDFDSILGTRDVVNMPERKEVGVVSETIDEVYTGDCKTDDGM